MGCSNGQGVAELNAGEVVDLAAHRERIAAREERLRELRHRTMREMGAPAWAWPRGVWREISVRWR